MKLETLHNTINNAVPAIWFGSCFAFAAAPTTLPVTITALALMTLSVDLKLASTSASCRVGKLSDDKKEEYINGFKKHFTLCTVARLVTTISIGILICYRMSDLLAPPEFAIRTPIS